VAEHARPSELSDAINHLCRAGTAESQVAEVRHKIGRVLTNVLPDGIERREAPMNVRNDRGSQRRLD